MGSIGESLETALREKNRPSMDLHPVLLSKGFVLEEIIGYGAYSCVKRAFDKNRRKNVAVKIISKRTANDNLVQKFIPRELDIIKDLQHGNIIRYYDFIETTMRFYIIMQYAEAGTLLELLKKKKVLSEDKSWDYFRQLVDALEYIHKLGIAHRDIKCDNIVLDTQDCLKVIDFGFACRVRNVNVDTGADKVPEASVLSKTFCGSHAYASPELLRHIPYEPQLCDVWAAGVVLYIMLTGRPPFMNSKNIQILLQNIDKGLPTPKEIKTKQSLLQMLQQIFVKAEKRINITKLRQCSWMQRRPRKTSSVENIENDLLDNGVLNLKRKKLDNSNRT